MRLSLADFEQRARRLRLLLLDVDGVLTDGTVTIDSGGGESKVFYIRDGAAIVWAMRQGLEIGFLSGRPSKATARRAAELGVRIVSQGGSDKRRGYAEILAAHGYADADIGYMADDLLDLPIFARAGLAAAPADAAEEVRARAHWVSRHTGGRGAVREFIEVVMRARGQWAAVVEGFLS